LDTGFLPEYYTIYYLSLSFGFHTTVGNMTPGFKKTKTITVWFKFGCCTTVHNMTVVNRALGKEIVEMS
jgi:hypothetical protein